MNSIERWTDEKLQALTTMELGDPETWPETMRHRLEGNSRLVGMDRNQENIPLLRLCILEEAISRRLADQNAYLELLQDALWGLAKPGSMETKLLQALDGQDTTYWSDSIELCLELVPRLDALFPGTTVPEILEALGSPRPDGVPESGQDWLRRYEEEYASQPD